MCFPPQTAGSAAADACVCVEGTIAISSVPKPHSPLPPPSSYPPPLSSSKKRNYHPPIINPSSAGQLLHLPHSHIIRPSQAYFSFLYRFRFCLPFVLPSLTSPSSSYSSPLRTRFVQVTSEKGEKRATRGSRKSHTHNSPPLIYHISQIPKKKEQSKGKHKQQQPSQANNCFVAKA